jgi:transketolase
LGIYQEEGEKEMISDEKVKELKSFANSIRIESIRTIGSFGSGHIGGAMSVVEVLAVLYGAVMKYDVENPRWEDRDWLVSRSGVLLLVVDAAARVTPAVSSMNCTWIF